MDPMSDAEIFWKTGATPVTRWMSATKSVAARWTPSQSSLATQTEEAFPELAMVNEEFELVSKETQASWPIADT